MIYTITLNPALDKTIQLENFKIDEVNRVLTVREDAGGKGINVSKMIQNLEGESLALGILAGKTGEIIRDQLSGLGILHSFIEGEGQTRTNLKVIDTVQSTYTDINENGEAVSEEKLLVLEKEIFSRVKAGDIIVLAGSIPKNVPLDIYKQWIIKAKGYRVKVIVDADGELLKNAIQAKPYLIKPNIHELERFVNDKLKSTEEIVAAGKQLIELNIENVIVSRGEEGSVLITKEGAYRIPVIRVPVKSTVGAGDAMVAGLAYGLHEGLKIREALALGVASSTATIQEEGTKMGNYESVMEIKKMVQFEEL